ncbi:MAG: FAD-binding oxidoreductase [Cyanobacteriota bacterium]|nr:FAD-binding oxidoreductase [Cyanobacteriota bacterium]
MREPQDLNAVPKLKVENSMKTYDWLVVGGGITGAALGYELRKQGFSVLLLEPDRALENATRYSYGGLAYWSGTSALTRQLCEEGIDLHRRLSEELEADTEFREMDLLLPIDPENDMAAIAADYQAFSIQPRPLSSTEAKEVEPLLNSEAIAGALQLPHGHINPLKTNRAYLQAFVRAGGEWVGERAVEVVREGDRAVGIETSQRTHFAREIVICAGAFSRALLKAAGVAVKLYFTQAEIVETPPVELRLRTLIMPAMIQRFALEARASQAEFETLWEEERGEPVPAILDPGIIQFSDGHLCLGQLSRAIADPRAAVDAAASEAQIRAAIAKLLPSLAGVAGTWHRCLVAFGANSLPVVGAIGQVEGLHLFSGFTNTLLFAPPLARHFARWAAGLEEARSVISNPNDRP